MFSIVLTYAGLTPLVGGWVGGSEKVQNYADIIHGWSLSKKLFGL